LGEADATIHRGIPVTTPTCTLIDLAVRLPLAELERAVNEADRLKLLTPGSLRADLEVIPSRPGSARLGGLLDRHTFVLTRSELEQIFIPIALRVGLGLPLTRRWLSGFEVDFHWPHLGLVVETDGLQYHRTPFQQARDRLRDQAHTAAGLTPLRFTQHQVKFHPGHVERTLRAVAGRLAA